jgi:S1-C subfamily serine protease
MTEFLASFSDAVAARVAASAPLLALVCSAKARPVNAIAWRSDIVVTSEQALTDQGGYMLVLPGGEQVAAVPAGRDPGTNVAVLRAARAIGAAPPPPAAEPRAGNLALVLGLGAAGSPTVQLGVVSETGPAWHSMAGGRIDRLLKLDVRGGRSAEGGLVIDAAGGVLGMAAAGPRGQMLVIPAATVAATLDPLLAQGRVARGWLGLGLQPVTVPPGLRSVAGQDQGRMVVSIAEGGPGDKAGLLPGDVLLSLDGQAVGDLRAIRACLGPESIGKSIAVRLVRGGELRTVALTVTARPAE